MFNIAVETLCQNALKVTNIIKSISRENGGFSHDVLC